MSGRWNATVPHRAPKSERERSRSKDRVRSRSRRRRSSLEGRRERDRREDRHGRRRDERRLDALKGETPSVSEFVVKNGLDARAQEMLREETLEIQRLVMQEGELTGKNKSAVLMSRIRRVKSSQRSRTRDRDDKRHRRDEGARKEERRDWRNGRPWASEWKTSWDVREKRDKKWESHKSERSGRSRGRSESPVFEAIDADWKNARETLREEPPSEELVRRTRRLLCRAQGVVAEVEFALHQDALKCVTEFDNKEFGGSVLSVELSKDTPNRVEIRGLPEGLRQQDFKSFLSKSRQSPTFWTFV